MSESWQIEDQIRSARQKIAEAERSLVEVNRMYRHDPPHWAERQLSLVIEIERQQQRLTDLDVERRGFGRERRVW
jgi:hypothetical protein